MRETLRQTEKGFTLVEVLTAVAILAFITLSVAQLFTLAVYNEANSRRRTDMTFMGQGMLERLISLPSTDPAVAPATLPACGSGLKKWSTEWSEQCFNSMDPAHRWPNTLQEARAAGFYMTWEIWTSEDRRFVHLYVVPYPATIQLVRPLELIQIANED